MLMTVPKLAAAYDPHHSQYVAPLPKKRVWHTVHVQSQAFGGLPPSLRQCSGVNLRTPEPPPQPHTHPTPHVAHQLANPHPPPCASLNPSPFTLTPRDADGRSRGRALDARAVARRQRQPFAQPRVCAARVALGAPPLAAAAVLPGRHARTDARAAAAGVTDSAPQRGRRRGCGRRRCGRRGCAGGGAVQPARCERGARGGAERADDRGGAGGRGVRGAGGLWPETARRWPECRVGEGLWPECWVEEELWPETALLTWRCAGVSAMSMCVFGAGVHWSAGMALA
eukprot:350740-Chlamydomonas_euryale.AAC.2